METTKILKLRIKDKHAKVILQMARDVNAARKIARMGHQAVAGGIPVVHGWEDVNVIQDLREAE